MCHLSSHIVHWKAFLTETKIHGWSTSNYSDILFAVFWLMLAPPDVYRRFATFEVEHTSSSFRRGALWATEIALTRNEFPGHKRTRRARLAVDKVRRVAGVVIVRRPTVDAESTVR